MVAAEAICSVDEFGWFPKALCVCVYTGLEGPGEMDIHMETGCKDSC